MRAKTILAVAVLGFGLSAAAGGAAFAEWGGRHAADVERGYVVAHSRHGNGSVNGTVRHTSKGAQVQLPGGTWEYCRRSCSETLRVETVDFWEGRQEGQVGLNQEKGVFGWIDWGFGF